jgi:transcriptional regulator with XRE-family HTH domain
MNIKKKFGDKLRELRVKAGYSQEEFAFKASLDRTYISSIERGERNVSIEVVEKIAEALELEITNLFEF